MIIFQSNHLAAALQCAAKKDVRYYLKGVCFRVNEAGQTFFISTDGHIAFVGRFEPDWTDGVQSGPFDLIIPRETVELALKGKSKTLTLTALPDGRYSLGDVIFAAVDGKFSDIDRVVPSTVDGIICQFDPDLLVTCTRALNLWGSSGKHVLHHNSAGASVMCADAGLHAFTIIMGMRANAMAGQDFHTFQPK